MNPEIQNAKRIFVYGSGGREHALVWKLRHEKYNDVVCFPGNGGIPGTVDLEGNIGRQEDYKNKEEYWKRLADYIKTFNYDLTVVGPEVPLSQGIVDIFERSNLRIFGPSQRAAELETSKIFAKEFMIKYGIPTAQKFLIPKNYNEAERFIKKYPFLRVIKADGLASGKGVFVTNTEEEALDAAKRLMIDYELGDAGKRILIEEKLNGEEISYIVFSDGKNIKAMLPAQDHKRIFDNDLGPNTGGMGAYSPAKRINFDFEQSILEEIVEPTINHMRENKTPYKGVLYFGLMRTDYGPKLLEYNCRFGDPETQAILPLMKSDLSGIMNACIDGRLDKINIDFDYEKYCCCIVIASKGYPQEYETGKEIFGLEEAEKMKDVLVFHAGTKRIYNYNHSTHRILTNGGRVLNVIGIGKTLEEARDTSYSAVKKISFEGMQYRKDIGAKGLV